MPPRDPHTSPAPTLLDEPLRRPGPPPVPGPAGRPGRPAAGALVRTARPRQWSKNVLVLAAPAAAGVLTDPAAVARTLAAVALFCVASSGTYFLNDAADVEADRAHPTKRRRPVAAGEVGVGTAVALGTVLLVASVAGAFALAGWQLALVLGVYAALQPLYSAWLKHVAVVDLAVVAAGFVLRSVAGGVAVDVPISQWFLIVASFGSLFMVSGKRHGEHAELGQASAAHRATLGVYSPEYLRHVRSVSSSVVLAAYCLWAFEKADVAVSPVWFQLSIVPFVLAILRYALLLDAGQGAAPEELVLRDRTLQVLGLAWVAVFTVGVHVR